MDRFGKAMARRKSQGPHRLKENPLIATISRYSSLDSFDSVDGPLGHPKECPLDSVHEECSDSIVVNSLEQGSLNDLQVGVLFESNFLVHDDNNSPKVATTLLYYPRAGGGSCMDMCLQKPAVSTEDRGEFVRPV